MKRLKRTIKEALAQKASIIRMRVNHLPEFEAPSGLAKAKTVDPVDLDFLSLMYREMFAGGEKFLSILQPVKGRLAVSGYGDFMLLAVPAEKALLIVPPHERQREVFEQLWSSVCGDTNAEVIASGVNEDNSKVSNEAKSPVTGEQKEENHRKDIAKVEIPPVPAPLKISAPPEGDEEAQDGLLTPNSLSSAPGKHGSTSTPPGPAVVKPMEVFPQTGHSEASPLPLAKAESNRQGPADIEEKIGPVPSLHPPTNAEVSSVEEEKVLTWDDTFTAARKPQVSPSAGLEANAAVALPPKAPIVTGVFTPIHTREHLPDDHRNTEHMSVRPSIEAQESCGSPGGQIYYGPETTAVREAQHEPFPIDALLEQMIERNASDLHMAIGAQMALRIDTEIVRLKNWLATEQSMAQMIEPIIPPRAKADFIKWGQTSFSYSLAQKGRFRILLYRDYRGATAAVHFLPPEVPSTEKLELSPHVLKWCEAGKGLVLISGASGAGKSTTMAALIDHINATKAKHIVTIEETIEYFIEPRMSFFHYIETGAQNHGFAAALKTVLRQDADIVAVSDLSDPAAMDAALGLVENGHLVIGGIPALGAISTIDRVIEQYPEDQRMHIRNCLADSLLGIVSQLLLKKKGGGRIVAMEILTGNTTVKSSIKENKTAMIKSLLQTRKSEGNQLLNEVLVELIRNGVVDPMDAYGKTTDRTELLQLLQAAGIPMRTMTQQVA